MIIYDLFLLLKNGDEKELVRELTDTYNDKLTELENNKIKYLECRMQMDKLSALIFVKEKYCLNPEASSLKQINTKLKTDPESLRLHDKYISYDIKERLYTERLWKLRDELKDINNILREYGINKDEERLNNIYK